VNVISGVGDQYIAFLTPKMIRTLPTPPGAGGANQGDTGLLVEIIEQITDKIIDKLTSPVLKLVSVSDGSRSIGYPSKRSCLICFRILVMLAVRPQTEEIATMAVVKKKSCPRRLSHGVTLGTKIVEGLQHPPMALTYPLQA